MSLRQARIPSRQRRLVEDARRLCGLALQGNVRGGQCGGVRTLPLCGARCSRVRRVVGSVCGCGPARPTSPRAITAPMMTWALSGGVSKIRHSRSLSHALPVTLSLLRNNSTNDSNEDNSEEGKRLEERKLLQPICPRHLKKKRYSGDPGSSPANSVAEHTHWKRD